MSVRRLVLLTAISLTVLALPSAALAGPDGAPVKGSFAGSGSSTVDFVAGHPILRWESSGTLKSTLFGPSTYELSIGSTGIVTFESFEITAKGGTVTFGAGPIFGSTSPDTTFTITGGTGRFANATGTLTLGSYAKANLSCVSPFPGVPTNLFCDWDESGDIAATIKMH